MNSLKFSSGIEKTAEDLLKLHNKYIVITADKGIKIFAFCYDVVIHTSDMQSSYIIVNIPQLKTTNKYIYLRQYIDVYIVEMDYLLNSKSTDL